MGQRVRVKPIRQWMNPCKVPEEFAHLDNLLWQQEDQALQETPCCDIALQLGVKIHSSHLFISIVRNLSSVNSLINSSGLAKNS